MSDTHHTTLAMSSPQIEEMLTMSSGLQLSMVESIMTLGGNSLTEALSRPAIGRKEFSYLGASQILSYVIEERAGLSPRQFLSERVLPALGIDDGEIEWEQNGDGMETAYHGLALTALQMAKFGQLYLQGGKASPDSQVVSKEWVDESFSSKTSGLVEGTDVFSYSFLWWSLSPGVSCALGLGGQNICVVTSANRVIVQQRDLTWEESAGDDLGVVEVGMNVALSFEPEEAGKAAGETLVDEPSEDKSPDEPDSPKPLLPADEEPSHHSSHSSAPRRSFSFVESVHAYAICFAFYFI